MYAIPRFIVLTSFLKSFVKTYTRKDGTVIQQHFDKRNQAIVQQKHIKTRFHDLNNKDADKAHAELESKKAEHQSILDAVKKYHDELKKRGSSKDDKSGISHDTKLAHLKAEIKNQETHIANHTRKQELIKNRYQINKSQVESRQNKSRILNQISDSSEKQQSSVKAVIQAFQDRKSNLEPLKVLTGKDKDHIYLEAKHKETGEIHHIAIAKDGTVHDPQIIHKGKFNPGEFNESKPDAKENKKITVKNEIKSTQNKLKSEKIQKPEILKEKKQTDQAKIEDWKKNGTESKAFKDWFGDSKVVDSSGKPLVVYHGTNGKFTEFNQKGEKLTALGYGYYFTPNIDKAKQYGKNIHSVYLKSEKLLDWGNLTEKQRGHISSELEKIVPKERLAGFSGREKKFFSESDKDKASSFFEKKLKEAKNYYHDRSKPDIEMADNGYYITYVDNASLKKASNENLLALAQEYDNNIAQRLGYDGVKYGSEIAVFNSNQIKSVNNQGTFDSNSDNMNKAFISPDIKSNLISQAKDQLAFDRANRNGKIEDYEAYIRFYPDGNYINQAKEKLIQLNKKKISKKQKLKHRSKKG